MIAFLLLLLGFSLLPAYPVFSLVAVSGAFWSASYWKADVGGVLEMVVFYGAVAGCLIVWFS